MTCSNCGRADLDPSARFCPTCGTALAPPTPATADDAPLTPSAADDAPLTPSAADDAPLTPAPTTTIDVRQDVGAVSGGRVTGVEVGRIDGGLTVNEAPGVVEGDLVGGDKHVHGDALGGDKISATIGNVGAGGQIAVGHHVAQIGGGGPGPLTAADRTALRIRAAVLRDALTAADLPEGRRLVAAEFLGQLEGECARADGPPDASTLKVAGEWLAANVPPLHAGLTALFGTPAGARLLAAAGEPVASWAAARFGV